MQGVYEFLGLPYCELDYTNIKQVTVENDRIGDFGIYGDHTIRKDVKPLKKDYNEILGKELCASIKNNYSWFFEEFRYF
jgi:hypothetical protein